MAASPAQRYLAACLKALKWAEERNYTGYSKFDALNSPLLRWSAGERRLMRGGFIYLVSRAPLNLRPLLGVEKRQNPNGLALFASTYFGLHRIMGDPQYLEKGLALLESLLEISQQSRYAGHCWGYCHDWQSYDFFIPRYAPNTVVTVFVAQAFLDAYRITGDQEFLAVADSSTHFLRENLNVTLASGEMKAYSYTPFDDSTTVNTNALIAGLFASVYGETREQALADETTRLANFLLDRQTDSGAWFHGDPPGASRRKIDNYHIAFILEPLRLVNRALGDGRVKDAYDRGLSFYNENLFLDNGAPKFESHHTNPHDIIGCSQGIVTFSHAATADHSWLARAERIADWTLENMWDPKGRFYFQKTGVFVKRYTLMRWCQAWMCYALLELARASSNETGESPTKAQPDETPSPLTKH